MPAARISRKVCGQRAGGAPRVQPTDQRVHRLAPGPEAAGAGREGLAAPAQAALEGVRVGGDQAGQERAAGSRRSAVAAAGRPPPRCGRPRRCAIWTPDSKRAPVQVRSASRTVDSSAPRRNGGPSARAARARAASSAFGRCSLGLWATSIDAGTEDGAVEPQALQPAGVGGEGDAGARAPGRPGRRGGGGSARPRRASMAGCRRAARSRGSKGAAASRHGAAHPLDQLRGGDPRQRADAELDDAAVGHHVDRRAAVDRADVERHEGDLREQLAVGRRLRLQLAAQARRAPRSPGRRARWR